MDYLNYEKHDKLDKDLPIVVHYDVVKKVNIHWHENIELLYFIDGAGTILCGVNSVVATKGDVVIINGNEIHNITAITEDVKYYCLIIDSIVYEGFVPNFNNIEFKNLIHNDEKVSSIIETIIYEMNNKQFAYKEMVRLNIINLVIYLTRNYISTNLLELNLSSEKSKIQLIKDSLNYLKNNYSHDISIDEVCGHIGISKFYFCRIFKLVTNMTVIEYLNILRCQKAQKLLKSGNFNVTQASELSGFNNITYFCKIYKNYVGYTPSQEISNNKYT